jgi:hypothetical protein
MQPHQIIADVFAYGDATGTAAVAALESAGWTCVRTEQAVAQETAVAGALDYLRNIPHEVLDERYEVDSMHRDLMEAIVPLARFHRLMAHSAPELGPFDQVIRDEVLSVSRRIVDHWTTGIPHFAIEDQPTEEPKP